METIETPTTEVHSEYAGFWLRLAAYIIDYFVLAFVLGTFVAITMLTMGISFGIFHDMEDLANQMIIGSFSIIIGLMAFVLNWLYFAILESGSYQGSLGKMALNLKVTDMEGQRISFARATGRFFGKFLSSFIIYIGYIMIGFTEKRQGLHDILAGCLVVRK